MQEALDAPAQVQDDFPTLRSELSTWWNKHLKPFLDFKTFLRQRDTILKQHEFARCAKPPYEGWKNPFEFALSATTLTFSIVAIVGLAFHALFPDPNVKADWISRNLQAQIQSVQRELAATPAQTERHALLETRSAQLQYDLSDHRQALTVPHEGLILTAGVPLVVYFLGVLFPRFIRRKVPDAEHAGVTREIVYYYFTARTFWPVFLLVVSASIYFFLIKYSLLSTYDEIQQTFPVTSGALFVLLSGIAAIGAIPLVYSIFAGPATFHKCASEMSRILGIESDPAARRTIYWGLAGSVVLSTIFAFTLVLLLVAGYTALDTGTQQLQTYLGHALSTV